MTDTSTAILAIAFHHLAIQTTDVENCASWYEEFLNCSRTWSLSEFSSLTRERLPGITRLVEVAGPGLRLHLFERAGSPVPDPDRSISGFQHLCLAVDGPVELHRQRSRWCELYASGRYSFSHHAAPTPVVVDAEGTHSFYAYDTDGSELELTCAGPRPTTSPDDGHNGPR